MNVDIGGGTSKIAVCADGKVMDVTAIDVGARLVVFDAEKRIVRLEEAGRRFGAELGLKLDLGFALGDEQARALAARMADRLFDAMKGGSPSADHAPLLRLDPLSFRGALSDVSFSGGVSEYIYGGEAKAFGDVGPQLAAEVRARLTDWGPQLTRPEARIRATVIGASQFTVQVSGKTIYLPDLGVLPVRNVPVGIDIDRGYSDWFWGKDVRFENVREAGIVISNETNVYTQIGFQNALARNTPVFAKFRDSGRTVNGKASAYLVSDFSHGLVVPAPGQLGHFDTHNDMAGLGSLPAQLD